MTCGYGSCRTEAPRPYPVGRRCAVHTPAALAGQPEPPSLAERGERPYWVREDGTLLPLTSIGTSWVQDTRAVARGQRVSGERRRAMQDAEAYEQASGNTL